MNRVAFPFAWLLLPFLVLATANSAGYRYGASDLAFYGPAVMRAVDPQLFPRDHSIIDAQARLTFMDETIGGLARLTTTNFPVLFLVLYLGSLTLLAAGAASIGATLYRHQWTIAALLIALSLRHAIAKTGANTLEAYFHPRQLAFAFGVLAVSAFLRGRTLALTAAIIGAALLHPTTTLWFGIWLGAALLISEQQWRRHLLLLAALSAVAGFWAVTAGPLSGRLVVMDNDWLAAVAEKEYLFPLEWPLIAWMVNLGYVPVIVMIYRRRRRAALVQPRERALVLGALSLVAVFFVAVALNSARVAIAIQLQPARVFWMLDFVAMIYIVWAVAEDGSRPALRPMAIAGMIIAASVLRGAYVMKVEFPGRPLFEAIVPGDWGRVMNWARTTSPQSGWLAHPNHASLYGTSLRMAAGRDVFVEGVKDAAIGMYDRTIAIRTRDRLTELGDFSTITPERARQLASKYDLDYLITDEQLTLPLTFSSGALRVYHLR